MKKVLVWAAALALALAACKTMEPRPDQPPAAGDCTEPGGEVPRSPPAQTIPETGTVPAVPQSTQIVVGLCPSTGQYQAMGVNTQTGQFTFAWRGGRATQPQAFMRFYEARVPVTVYTSAVRLTAGAGRPVPIRGGTSASASVAAIAPAASTPQESAMGPAPVPTPPPNEGSEGDPDFDPCETISEEPPTSPGPKGGQASPTWPTAFQSLTWRTAHALNAISDPVGPVTAPGTAPAPQ